VAGFTLIEVLIALIVSVVLVGGLVRTMHQGWSEALRLRGEGQAILVARTVLTLLDDQGWSDSGTRDGDAASYHWQAEAQEIPEPETGAPRDDLDRALERERQSQPAQPGQGQAGQGQAGQGQPGSGNAQEPPPPPPIVYAIRITVTDPTGKTTRLEAIRVQAKAQ
jgi:prepilin-type N-terminal cleavage/methylation domain-containing protein